MKYGKPTRPIDQPIRKLESTGDLKIFDHLKNNFHYGSWHHDFGLDPIFDTYNLNPDIGKQPYQASRAKYYIYGPRRING